LMWRKNQPESCWAVCCNHCPSVCCLLAPYKNVASFACLEGRYGVEYV